MPYKYSDHRDKIFTDEGQRDFLKVRDKVHQMLQDSGAFMMMNAWKAISGDSWLMTAYVDRLVELGEISEIEWDAIGQCRVFIKG